MIVLNAPQLVPSCPSSAAAVQPATLSVPPLLPLLAWGPPALLQPAFHQPGSQPACSHLLRASNHGQICTADSCSLARKSSTVPLSPPPSHALPCLASTSSAGCHSMTVLL